MVEEGKNQRHWETWSLSILEANVGSPPALGSLGHQRALTSARFSKFAEPPEQFSTSSRALYCQTKQSLPPRGAQPTHHGVAQRNHMGRDHLRHRPAAISLSIVSLSLYLSLTLPQKAHLTNPAPPLLEEPCPAPTRRFFTSTPMTTTAAPKPPSACTRPTRGPQRLPKRRPRRRSSPPRP